MIGGFQTILFVYSSNVSRTLGSYHINLALQKCYTYSKPLLHFVVVIVDCSLSVEFVRVPILQAVPYGTKCHSMLNI